MAIGGTFPAASSSLAAVEYGAVSHRRSKAEGSVGRLGRIMVYAATIVAVGLLFAAGTERRHRSALVAKVPRRGSGLQAQPDVSGILEDTIEGDPDLDNEFQESESKLLGKIETKLESHVEGDVNSEVQQRIKQMKKEEKEKHIASLVDEISKEMGSVTSGLKAIEALKAKQRATVGKISELENDVSSEASRDLFLQAAAYLLKSNLTGNATDCNATACSNATGASEGADEGAAAEEGGEEAAGSEPASERVVNPHEATRLHVQAARKLPNEAWQEEEDSTIKRMSASIQLARMQKKEEEGLLHKMMASWQHFIGTEAHKPQPAAAAH